MRTQAEKNDALVRLSLNKTRCKPRSFFGEDNHAKIDAMIKVIQDDMDDNDCYNEFEDTECLTEALSTYEYLQGQCEVEDLLFPEH